MNPSAELPLDNRANYDNKFEALKKRLAESGGLSPGLSKSTSNLFRHREPGTAGKIDLSGFNGVVCLYPDRQIAEVEGVATYETIVDALLPLGYIPTVIPELKTITLGGAVTGIGIESSSFKFGFVHETVESLDILTGDREILHCTRDNAHSDLFYGFPNSYGTFGYALKVAVAVQPVKKFVHLTYVPCNSYKDFFLKLEEACATAHKYDFVDGVIYSASEMVAVLAEFTDSAPHTSDYTYMNIFYQSIRTKKEDYLTTRDYLWRWDTDWFWCSRAFYAQKPWMRRLYGRNRLRSTTYWKIRDFCNRSGIIKLLEKFSGQPKEAVIQDVEIPIQNAPAFMAFFHENIGISPVWTCPVKTFRPEDKFSLYPMEPTTLHINFGFWDVIPSNEKKGYFNGLVEEKVEALQGKKSLYSDSYYTPEKFWQLYNKVAYDELKRKYDPDSRFKNLYDKCVRRQK